MSSIPFIFEITVLVFSIIIHEVSHGYVAELLGDPTARLQGRLTLNPIKHIDPIGSIIVPIITSLGGGAVFGWAKPVPFNPFNLKNRRSGEVLIAIAGPISNFLIALIFGTIIRLGFMYPDSAFFTSSLVAPFLPAFITLSTYIVLVNVSLATFNLIPFPPLDGSKLLFAAFPQNQKWNYIRANIERYSIFLVIILVYLLWGFFTPIIPVIFYWFTGIHIHL